jgi:dephospho-CoA kinase
MKIIGLTGGIGMGKSTAAAAFRRARIPVFDADLAVHRMQARGGPAVRVIEAAFPGATSNGSVDRAALRRAVLGNPEALTRLEHILHPMVEAEERAFVGRARRSGRRAVVLDIPLLFETRGDKRVDTVVVVSAPRAVQIYRVGLRRGMSRSDVEAVIARQMPDAEKRRRAHLVVQTGLSRNHTLRILNRFIHNLLA